MTTPEREGRERVIEENLWAAGYWAVRAMDEVRSLDRALRMIGGRVPADLSTAVYTVLQTLQYAGYAKKDDDA